MTDNSERPLLPILFYLLHEARTRFQDEYFRVNNFFLDSFGGRGQVGSLAGFQITTMRKYVVVLALALVALVGVLFVFNTESGASTMFRQATRHHLVKHRHASYFNDNTGCQQACTQAGGVSCGDYY